MSDAEKDARLDDHAAVIEAMAARIAELEAKLSAPKKSSRTSHLPPSSGPKANRPGKGGKKTPPPSRPGTSRRLAQGPDETLRCRADACGHCGADVSGQVQQVRRRCDHVDIPPVVAHATRIELPGGRCACCGRRFRAEPPAGMAPGTPFGPYIHALLLYLHHSHL